MSPERWQRIQTLFHEATELDGPERMALLDRIGAEDADIRREVENLLRADEHPSLLLESGPGDLAALVLEEDDSLPDERIGPYRIIREIGRGGMGAVYLAERADGQFSMQVAIKLVKRGVDTDEILRRFRYEREILARLDHPNVARLIDGGATSDGRPYLVMEYVEGERLDAYCDARRLGIEARLRLFLTVCDAVQYAHRNLVIHRDLKPANILVNEEGQIKLLDFGIAKLLDEEDQGLTNIETRTGLRVMTPEYASPEQLCGDPITTAVDVYALGILLYELLTGHRPFERSRRMLESPETVRRNEPRRPSTVVGRTLTTREDADADVSIARGTTEDRLRRRLRGDLDTIVLKALRAEPSDRYASAEALLNDVRNHLEGRPVAARPHSLPYRMWKYANRHRAAVAVTAAFVLMASSFAVLHTVRVTQERDRAQRELREKEAVTSFLTELFYAASPSESRGDTLNAYDLLERGAMRIETELTDQPSVQAHLMHIISHVYHVLGNNDRALELAERSLEIREQHLSTDYAAIAVAVNQLGNVYSNMGDYPSAESHYRRGLELRRRVYAAESPEVSESIMNLGLLLSNSGRYDEAEPLLREALTIDRRLRGDVHPEVATDLNNLAVMLYFKGEYAEAGKAFEEALAIRREVYGEPHPRVALTMNNLASILRRTGDFARAEALFRESLEMSRVLFGDEHPDVPSTLSNLAAVVQDQGHPEQALPLLQEAVSIGRNHLGDHPQQADALSNMGSVLYELGRYDEAEQSYNESLAINLATRGETHPRTALIRYHLGRIAAARFDRAAAEAHFRAALALQEAKLPEHHDETANTRRDLALLLLADASRIDQTRVEAESLLVLAERALEKTYGSDDPRVVQIRELTSGIGQGALSR